MFHLGIVGHRYLRDDQTRAFISHESSVILKDTRAKHDEVVALSAIAEGADTLFAEAAIDLDIPLEIVRPFEEYAADFEEGSARERYEKLRAVARREVKLPYQRRSNKAYQAAMSWIVVESDLLAIAWDGQPAAGPGGTGDAIEQLTMLGRPWVHLDVTTLSVKFHP
jgi:hypothetical protein